MQTAQYLQHHVNGGASRLAINLDLLPGCLLVQVAICRARNRHRRVNAILKVAIGDVMPNERKAAIHLRQYLAIRFAQRLRVWHNTAELALQESQGAMHGVAVGGYQFIIVAAN